MLDTRKHLSLGFFPGIFCQNKRQRYIPLMHIYSTQLAKLATSTTVTTFMKVHTKEKLL